jgi:hypothetical protein
VEKQKKKKVKKMKKLFLISILAVLFIGLNAQSPLKRDSESLSTTSTWGAPAFVYFWGTTNDTLTASDSIVQVIRTQGDGLMQIAGLVKVTKVSGTVTNNLFVSGSMDGVRWTRVDTIAYSNASSGWQELNDPCYSNWNYAYMKWQGISGATAQKAWYHVILEVRY